MQKEDRVALREEVKRDLLTYSDQGKVIFAKETLENLLFETKTINIHGKWYQVKIPVWFGDFLSKIDLSMIDFSDVLWNYDICMALNNIFGELLSTIAQIRSTIPESKPSFEIYYANTNAKINFAESFLTRFGQSSGIQKYYGLVSIAHCNFSGTAVNFGEGVNAIQILNSTLSNCNLRLPNISRLTIMNSDLSNNNLSNLSIDVLSNHFYGTSFKNSGINVYLDPNEMERYLATDEITFKKLFIAMLNDYFAGCSVNGHLLSSHPDEEHNLNLILKK